MRHKIFILLLCMALSACLPGIAATTDNPVREKSKVEVYMQQLSKIKSPEINYAYISFNMLKRLFSMASQENRKGANIVVDGIESTPFALLKSVRRFVTTGSEGYAKLRNNLLPFLSQDEEVMGMELMAMNVEDGALSVVYSDSQSVLLITDTGDAELSVVFVVGLSYTVLNELIDGGFDFDFMF